jgi:hypothetical protein
MLQISHDESFFRHSDLLGVYFFFERSEGKPHKPSHVLDKKGNILQRFGSWGEKEGEWRIPHDIAVDQSGNCMSQSLRIRGCRNLN